MYLFLARIFLTDGVPQPSYRFVFGIMCIPCPIPYLVPPHCHHNPSRPSWLLGGTLLRSSSFLVADSPPRAWLRHTHMQPRDLPAAGLSSHTWRRSHRDAITLNIVFWNNIRDTPTAAGYQVYHTGKIIGLRFPIFRQGQVSFWLLSFFPPPHV